VKDQVSIDTATSDDLDRLELIRQEAFKPVFESFENILGSVVYEHAQKPEDLSQKDTLKEMLQERSVWSVYVMKVSGKPIGFVSVRIDAENLVGEIGLNAIHPDYAGKGYGTEMYNFAIGEMETKGMKVATVATGGDPSHAPARKAYEKAGFNIQIPSVWYCKEL